jgi:hypothetical protein
VAIVDFLVVKLLHLTLDYFFSLLLHGDLLFNSL